MTERLHKILAQHGLGSRREVERWITEGRLKLNGRNAQTGDRYNEGDRVMLDGKDVTKRLQVTVTPQVLAYHKAQGQALDRAVRDRKQGNREDSDGINEELGETSDFGETVQDRLPAQRGVRWVPINPMHPGDSGLLLLTNDGKLGYALTRHKKHIPAEYMVRVYVRGGAPAAPQLPTSLRLDNETVEFTQVELTTPVEFEGETDNVWYKVGLARADKRAAVRALFVSHGLTISRMMQVSFAGIELTKDLPRNRHQLLKPAQMNKLYEAAELPAPQLAGGSRTYESRRGSKHAKSATRDRKNVDTKPTKARPAKAKSAGRAGATRARSRSNYSKR